MFSKSDTDILLPKFMFFSNKISQKVMKVRKGFSLSILLRIYCTSLSGIWITSFDCPSCKYLRPGHQASIFLVIQVEILTALIHTSQKQ